MAFLGSNLDLIIIITLLADLVKPQILAYVAYPVQIFTHLR